MRARSVIPFIIVLCFLTGCMSSEKTDALMTSTSMVVKEYDAVATEYAKLVDLLIQKNPDSEELLKMKEALKTSQVNVGNLAVSIKALLESTSLDASQQQQIIEILDRVLPAEEG